MLKIKNIRSVLQCVLLFIISLTGCTNESRIVTPSFYHWQTHLSLSIPEHSLLDQLGIQKIYPKFFDVDWDFIKRSAVPKAIIQFTSANVNDYKLVPTIFITNRTFIHIPDNQIDHLVQKIYGKIQYLAKELPIEEIQIDCDWTNSTRIKYFDFLEKMKEVMNKHQQILSTTIRLHQFKNPDLTGVPPVPKGTLMVYNVGALEQWPEQNSILSKDQLLPYLQKFNQYPLHLDIALPIFAWGVVYRKTKMIKLVNNLRAEMLKNKEGIKQITENRFELTKSRYINGYYFYAGDRIRTEAISPELLLETAQLLDNQNPDRSIDLTFYHLDTSTIKYYTHEHFQQVISIFER